MSVPTICVYNGRPACIEAIVSVRLEFVAAVAVSQALQWLVFDVRPRPVWILYIFIPFSYCFFKV